MPTRERNALRPGSLVLPAVFLLLFFAALSGCAKKEAPPAASSVPAAPKAETAVPGPPPAPPPVPAAPAVAMKPTPGAKNPAKEAPPPPKPQSAIAKEDPLFGLPGQTVAASDFTLGALQTPTRGTVKEREVYKLFSAFLTKLKEGGDYEDLVHPDYRSFLFPVLQAVKKAGKTFESFRIGELKAGKNDVFEASILLFGKEGRTAGKILGEKKDDAFYVSGLLADFSRLGQPYKREGEEPFLPVPPDSPFR